MLAFCLEMHKSFFSLHYHFFLNHLFVNPFKWLDLHEVRRRNTFCIKRQTAQRVEHLRPSFLHLFKERGHNGEALDCCISLRYVWFTYSKSSNKNCKLKLLFYVFFPQSGLPSLSASPISTSLLIDLWHGLMLKPTVDRHTRTWSQLKMLQTWINLLNYFHLLVSVLRSGLVCSVKSTGSGLMGSQKTKLNSGTGKLLVMNRILP